MKKVNKRIAAAVTVFVLSVALVMQNARPLTAQARTPVKEETVSVKADAAGNPYKATAENRLSGFTEDDVITDVTTLTEVKNRYGDEEYTADANGTIRWDNHGADIRYEGDADTTALPFALHISYELNGRQMTPEEIAGKSGRFRIRLDYDNLTTGEDYVPFVFLTALMLDDEAFSDLQVKNGNLSRMDQYAVALGMVLPGLKDALHLGGYEATEKIDLPEYIEITGETTGFAVEFSITVVTNGLFADLDTEGLEDVEEMIDNMADISEASSALVSALSSLQSGSAAFRAGLAAYTTAVSQIGEGVAALSAGLGTLNENATALSTGASSLASGLNTLHTSLSQINLSALTSGLSGVSMPDTSTLTNDMTALGTAVAGLGGIFTADGFTENVQALSALLAAETDSDKQAVLQRALQDLTAAGAAAGQIGTSYGSVVTDMGALTSAGGGDLSGLQSSIASFSAQFTQLQQGVAALAAGANQLSEGVNAYTAGVAQAAGGAAQLQSALNTPIASQGAAAGETVTLLTAGGQLLSGYDAISAGISAVASGMRTFHEEAITSLQELAGEELRDIITAIRTVKEADDAYTTFSGAGAGYESSVRFLIETDAVKP